MNYPKEIYDPNFIPDDLLGPGDKIPRLFGHNATVTNYFVVQYDGPIILLYGCGDILVNSYGEFHNARVIGGNVVARGSHIMLSKICVIGGSIDIQGSFIASNSIVSLPKGKEQKMKAKRKQKEPGKPNGTVAKRHRTRLLTETR